MKYFVVAACCTVAVGCNEASNEVSKPAARTNGPTNRTDVTVAKPVVGQDHRTVLDNTAVNVRDRDHATKTPLDQNENKTDINTTADIRKRVMDGKMSVDAQNVKIITQDGKVTLRGPVKSVEEKQRIEQIATEVAGANSVVNELEVEAAK